jgi:hypothetical protein
MVARHLVENIAVNEQEAPAVGRFRGSASSTTSDVAEGDAAVVAQRLVVVAGNEHHPLAVARPAQQFLHHGVLRGVPVMLRLIAQKSMMSPIRYSLSAGCSRRKSSSRSAWQARVPRWMSERKTDLTLGMTSAMLQINVRVDRICQHAIPLVGIGQGLTAAEITGQAFASTAFSSTNLR